MVKYYIEQKISIRCVPLQLTTAMTVVAEEVGITVGDSGHATPGVSPLRLAIYNQVNYHLHVVAGAMRVLQPLTSAPVTVFLTSKVIQNNWYGFMDWLGNAEGILYKELDDYDGSEAFE